MKSPFVKDLEPNQLVTTTFLVQSKEVRNKRGGEFYLSLILSDRTGELDAKMWDNVAEVMDTFDRDDFVQVKGLVQIFHNRPQLTIHKMRLVAESEIDPVDYFPASLRDPSEMWAELQRVIAGVRNPHLKSLLDAMFGDPEIAALYRRAPAAKQIHHAFLGGLLEHVLSLCSLAKAAAAHYPHVDYDLLITGVLLHDIGKIYELTYDRGFGYSDEGQLIGHIEIGIRMIGEKLRGLPDFPRQLRVLVEHLVLSHHGKLEFGSPKLPLFPEALLLHYLDDMDSKMESMRALIERDRQVEGSFTGYNNALERTVLKKDRYLRPAAVRERSAPPAPAVAPTAAPAVAAAAAPSAPVPPAPAPRPAPAFAPRPAPASPFAEKLQIALKPATKQEV